MNFKSKFIHFYSRKYNLKRHFQFFRPQIAKFLGPTWGPPGSCRPQMSPMLAPCTLLSGTSMCKGCFTVGLFACQAAVPRWANTRGTYAPLMSAIHLIRALIIATSFHANGSSRRTENLLPSKRFQELQMPLIQRPERMTDIRSVILIFIYYFKVFGQLTVVWANHLLFQHTEVYWRIYMSLDWVIISSDIGPLSLRY